MYPKLQDGWAEDRGLIGSLCSFLFERPGRKKKKKEFHIVVVLHDQESGDKFPRNVWILVEGPW